MKKDTIRGGIGLAVLVVLYHLVVFLIPFAKTATFWISYVFTLAAFAVAAVALYIAFGRKDDAKSKFYGFPIAKLGVGYGVIQLVAGLAFMALGMWAPWWLAVLVFAVGLGAAAIGLISADAVTEQIHVQDEKLKKNVAMMRSLQSKVNQMAAQCELDEVKKFADEIRYSDPVSSDGLWEAERELSVLIDELQVAVVDGDDKSIRQLCSKASAALAERNRLCKLNKN